MLLLKKNKKIWLALAAALWVAACGGGGGGGDAGATSGNTATTSPAPSQDPSNSSGTPSSPSAPGAPAAPTNPGSPMAPAAKSAKRGIAYDIASAADLAALAPGVSWWYNWSPRPNSGLSADSLAHGGMDFIPMAWGGAGNDPAAIEAYLAAHPQIKYLLVLNEPNLSDQANLTPQQAAAVWPTFEAIAAHTGVKLVGPALTWGTMPGYADPVVWMDAFIDAYRGAHGNRAPQLDHLAFHWYDYGLAAQLDRLKKYGKPVWVTEFANWHSQADGAQIDTPAKQRQQMTEMVAVCEGRDDVFRYAWFTGRWNPDPHFTSLLGAPGQLTELGQLYLSLPLR